MNHTRLSFVKYYRGKIEIWIRLIQHMQKETENMVTLGKMTKLVSHHIPVHLHIMV